MEKNVFDQLVKNYIKIHDNIQKIMMGQGEDYITGCLLDYLFFKEYYKMIAIDLRKQQAVDVDPKAIEQINFSEDLE